MLTKLFEVLGTATDVRSAAAIVLGILTTVLGHNSVIVKAVVDGVAGLIVLVDTFQLHKTRQAAVTSQSAAEVAHANAAAAAAAAAARTATAAVTNQAA
jgi:hypothetical protein